MRPRFRPGLTEARHETVEGILSPEERRFLLSLALLATMPNPALPDATMPMHFVKIIEGMEPGEMLPLTLRNREENNTCEAD
jgi:hypothetical protein